MSRPLPAPRTQILHLDKTEGSKPIKCSSGPQSPTRSSKGGLVGSAPPPVAPKKFTIKRSPGGFESENDYVEIVAVMAEQSIDNKCKATPPPLPPPRSPKEQADDKPETLDTKSLLERWKTVKPWKDLCKDLKLKGYSETKIISVKAEHLYMGIQVYNLLLSARGGDLKEQTAEMLCIADNLDKVSKGTKIAGITGGATTVAGGVAAAAGVILSPLTLGASLALTAVGVGVAAAGGITGASAAIANKVNVTQDKKKIEKTFQEYECLMEDIQNCLKFIDEGMKQLQQHDLSVLSEARKDSARVAKVVQLATSGGGSTRAIEANSKASGMMQGLALGLDMHFIQGKDGNKLKKGHESKLARKIRSLSEDLNTALDELMQLRDLYSTQVSVE
ncbi:apolipoprotein L3-like isoform X1 [Acanthopagrus latus]|uniref:apolipoprotein L3-like isoform X1 n=1 Tax=Acanthopagrus latus TaxID=8177 RepID=UPI00187D0299|nr:apolipoprotein L3-like isoform X1 [Acanthopagrus latus]XP_036934421.1 apolipoprotein L3-like isoform X1 [Acanthopagrus latus]